MKIGIIDTFTRVHHLGRQMHPSYTLNSIKHQILLLTHTLLFFSSIRKWFDISDNPLLTFALNRFPLMSGAIYWPYINYTWRMEQRLHAIDQHFRMLNSQSAIIAHATFHDIELARFDEEYAGLRLVLDKASWFLREGEIVLNLFVNDQRLYSIAFTLGVNDGHPLIFVGALQGSNSEAALRIYRDMTHALHGMRPRDFLMVALKHLCGELGIGTIWAISNEKRQHNSPYFGNSHKKMVLVTYNNVWLEHGGKELDNGFYEIPAIVKYKDKDEIATRKRATYRRRYAVLDRLALDIKAACTHYSEQALAIDSAI